jgi:two-component system, chemotaxis family, sensor kinase CheA
MSERDGKPSEKALQEFISEAQEIVEALARDLLRLDEQRAQNKSDPDLVNDAFRAVHSLKGLSGLFGVPRMVNLSHNLENLLDGLRLGRVLLSAPILDLLFEAVEVYQRLIADTSRGTASEGTGVEDLIVKLDRVVLEKPRREEGGLGDFDLDESVLSVLTEYEEHRLRENVRLSRVLYRVHCAFDLLTIDKGLEDLKQRLKPIGEVITYLPSAESGNDQQIELDLIVGSAVALEEVERVLEGSAAQVGEVPRLGGARAARPASPEAAGGLLARAPASPPPTSERPAAHLEPSPPADPGDAAGSLRSVSQTVRVDIHKLDHLMNVVGELALARAGIAQVLERIKADRTQAEVARTLHHEVRALDRKLHELQAGILEVRMVPLGQVFDKLSRVVRKISREAGKEIRFAITGADTELDKLIVEELSDPLMHIIRNGIDHGIEVPERRLAAGKPETGTIALAAYQKGNHVVIDIEDDGAGLDEQAIVRNAVARGLVPPEQAAELGRREIYNLIFLPGVSTKEVADEISGRGVGMDVVKTNIAKLSGIIDVQSQPEQGTKFSITLPITLAIIQALVIRACGRTYCIPLNSVLESLIIDSSEIRTIERREVITLRGATLPLARLAEAFALPGGERRPSGPLYVVVVGLAQHRLGLVVDDLVAQQDIVIKPLGKTLSQIPGIAGATELGGQQTVLVLDVAALVEEALSRAAEAA